MGRPSTLRHVPSLPGRRVDQDAHLPVRGRIDKNLVRRAEPRLQRARLAAARAWRERRSLGRLRPIAVDLDRRDDDEDRSRNEQPEAADERVADAHHADAGEHEQHADDGQQDPDGPRSVHAPSPGAHHSRVGCADASGSTTTAVPYATISDIVPASSELSNRIETTAFAPISVAFWTRRSIA